MIEVKCEYFGKCGGCTSQHIPYDVQLENKKQALQHALHYDDIKVIHDEPYKYRNRMDMIFHTNGIGFRERGNWRKIIDVKACPISNQKLNELITEVREYFINCDSFDVKKHMGTFRYAVIRTPRNDSSISFVLNSDSTRIKEAIEKITEFSKITHAKNVIVTYVPSQTDVSISSDFFVVKGSDMLTESYLNKTFQYSVQGFFQNNHSVSEKMHEYVRGLFKKSNSHLLDLYGGVGTFGIINADLFESVVCIESVKECIDAANLNIKENKVSNMTAHVLDAKSLRKLTLSQPLTVITDPPRSGMHPKTIEHLNALKPETIIYVSCNVSQLKKDIPKFKEYSIKRAALFDMFPQTNHCEAVVQLTKVLPQPKE